MSDNLLKNLCPDVFSDTADLTTYKQAVKTIQQHMADEFDNNIAVDELIARRSQLIDELLQLLCNNICQDSTVALLAVGGYGRREMHPASDIDILILLAEADNPSINENLESLLMKLWDIGLEVGHAVRTVDECIAQAKNDVTIMTNLLESRFLFGEQSLYEQLETKLAGKDIWPGNEFFAAKVQELQNRYAKYDDTSGNLEPNIKESPGGLRDIQTIVWIIMRKLGSSDLASLVEFGFLTEKEHDIFHSGLVHLWEIRFALHLHTGKHEDRLLFDYQKSLASRFGYTNDEHNLAVEYFMQNFYRIATEVSRLTEMLLQLFEESYLQSFHPLDRTPITDDFVVIGNFIEAVDNELFIRKPSALLEVFLLTEQREEIKGVRANTVRLIREHAHLIDNDFRQDSQNQALFIDIMGQKRGVTHQLRRMNRYGILAAYLPEFQHIVGRMQYDLFHTYTVDVHSLFVVRNIRRTAVAKHNEEFPLASHLIQLMEKPELLYIAGLLHDIGKGKGGDHSEIGATITLQFCERHSLSEKDTKLIVWLVANHLNMSMTAQRKDIEDPSIIREFADLVGNTEYLDHLYILTLCDSRATNPKRWNSWRNSILMQLYRATYAMLEKDTSRSITALVAERQQSAQTALLGKGYEKQNINEFWATLNMDYFMRCTVEELRWQTALILDSDNGDLPIINIIPHCERGSTEIFIYGKDTANLFARTTRLLEQLSLSIVSARLVTSDNHKVINSYFVLEEDESVLDTTDRIVEVQYELKTTLWDSSIKIKAINRLLPRHLKHFNTEPTIKFKANAPQPGETTLFISAGNRPGLLADISQEIAALNITVLNARIATVGEVIEDNIILQSANKTSLTDEQMSLLSETLNTMLSSD